jgi:hypothetical protein
VYLGGCVGALRDERVETRARGRLVGAQGNETATRGLDLVVVKLLLCLLLQLMLLCLLLPLLLLLLLLLQARARRGLLLRRPCCLGRSRRGGSSLSLSMLLYRRLALCAPSLGVRARTVALRAQSVQHCVRVFAARVECGRLGVLRLMMPVGELDASE